MTVATLSGFVVLWLVLDRTAATLGSYRGEWGVVVALFTVAAAVVVDGLLARCSPAHAAIALGLGWPQPAALLTAFVLSIAMLAFFPIYTMATHEPLRLRPDWIALLPGLFAQGGIAEEVVFRGFLFRHLRQGRGFWSAASLSALPFVAVHLILFATLDFVVALATLLVALSLTFPLAWLFERAGNSIWPSAIVHFAIQGSIKLLDVEPASLLGLAVGWMVLSAAAPWIMFLVLRAAPNRTP